MKTTNNAESFASNAAHNYILSENYLNSAMSFNHRIKQTVTFVFQNYFKFYQLLTVRRTQNTTNQHGNIIFVCLLTKHHREHLSHHNQTKALISPGKFGYRATLVSFTVNCLFFPFFWITTTTALELTRF